jgi:hypothetical protein
MLVKALSGSSLRVSGGENTIECKPIAYVRSHPCTGYALSLESALYAFNRIRVILEL